MSSLTSHSAAREAINICYIGAGFVGGPAAVVVANRNPDIRVNVVDRDEERIRRWNSKHLPIFEPGLRDAVTRTPNVFFSVKVGKCIGEADIVFIAVDTPTKSTGVGAGCATDMAAFEAVAVEIAKFARPGTIIVEKSTVPCGTARLVESILTTHRPDDHFEILSNPEFLSAGTAVFNLMCPDRVLIGSAKTDAGRNAAQALIDLYSAWIPRERIFTTDAWSSELSKLVANAMLAQRISSINSISAICEKTGADVDEVTIAVGLDPRIGCRFLKAGIGFGGSCLKKDLLSLAYLADSLGLEEVSEYWRQVIKLNEYQCDRFCRRIIRCLNNTLVDKKITILGYSFKAGTSDTRESLSVDVIKALLHEKPREIAIFDPCCNPAMIGRELDSLRVNYAEGFIVVYSDAYEACADSNAVVITTDCHQFRLMDSESMMALSIDDSTNTNNVSVVLPSMSSILQSADGDELGCGDDCSECARSTCGFPSQKTKILDWKRIGGLLKKPKWVFDGSGSIDPNEMAALGTDIQVERVGRQGWV